MSDTPLITNFEDVTFRAGKAAEKKYCKFSVYKGTLGFAAWNGESRPSYRKSLKGPAIVLFTRQLKQLLNAAPETRVPFTFTKYNEGKDVFDSTIILIKDEKQCCYLEVNYTDEQTNESPCLRFPLSGFYKFQTGSDPLTPAQRSQIAVESLINYIEYVSPIGRALTYVPYRPNPQGGGNANSGGAASAPKSDFGSSNPAGNDSASW